MISLHDLPACRSRGRIEPCDSVAPCPSSGRLPESRSGLTLDAESDSIPVKLVSPGKSCNYYDLPTWRARKLMITVAMDGLQTRKFFGGPARRDAANIWPEGVKPAPRAAGYLTTAFPLTMSLKWSLRLGGPRDAITVGCSQK